MSRYTLAPRQIPLEDSWDVVVAGGGPAGCRPPATAAAREGKKTLLIEAILITLPERSVREDATVGENVLLYKTALKLQPVLEALERCRATRGAGNSDRNKSPE